MKKFALRTLSAIPLLAVLLGGSLPAFAAEQKVTLSVAMWCASCPYIIKQTLAEVPGVLGVVVSYDDQVAIVQYDDSITNVAALTLPDWSVVRSRTVCQALEAIFQTCDWRDRWSGFDDAQDRTLCAILRSFPRIGHAPSVADLTDTTGLAPDRLRSLIDNLSARDRVVLDSDDATLIGAYPFTDRDTEHHVRLGDVVLNAMCAIDALGAGAMLGVNSMIASSCRSCGGAIRIETGEGGLSLVNQSPQSAVVWVGDQYADRCAAESLCTTMTFFCSDAHLDQWRADQDTDPRGFRLSMDEGLQMGKAIFMPLLAAACTIN